MSNKSSSVFGGSHGRWEFGGNLKQPVMSTHKPKEEPLVSIPVPDSTVNMSSLDNEAVNVEDKSDDIFSFKNSDPYVKGNIDSLKLIFSSPASSMFGYEVPELGCIAIFTDNKTLNMSSVWVPYSRIVEDENGGNKIVPLFDEVQEKDF